MTSRADRFRRSGGGVRGAAFTLVELLIVLTLLGVLSTTAAVAFQGRERPYALRVSAEDLGAAFRAAVSGRRMTGRAHRVVVDPALGVFWVEEADAAAVSGFGPVAGMAGGRRAFAEGVRFFVSAAGPVSGDGTAVFVFAPGGEPGALSCRLLDATGDQLAVTVLPGTGQVRVGAVEDETGEL